MGTMSIMNQAAVEALCAAKYLENYLDCMENLPDDLQRNVSLLRELDCQTCDHMKEIAMFKESYKAETEAHQKKRTLNMIQRALVKVQEIGDEKLQIVSQVLEFIENRSRQLEIDLENLDPSSALTNRREEEISIVQKIVAPVATVAKSTVRTGGSGSSTPHHQVEEKPEQPVRQATKRQRRQRTHQDSVSKEEEKKEEKPKKKKKRKVKKEREGEGSPHIEPIDPDEPTYCLCDQVSYGEMIGCDNEECTIEWFHFNCVGLTHKPKGKWYCPNCRGDKPNIKRPDLK